jgi:iodotyrosine deiodinase
MAFLNDMLHRPPQEKPLMILPVGYPATDATVPEVAKRKKPFDKVATVFR